MIRRPAYGRTSCPPVICTDPRQHRRRLGDHRTELAQPHRGAFPEPHQVQLTGQTYACECIYAARRRCEAEVRPVPARHVRLAADRAEPAARIASARTTTGCIQVVHSAGMLWGAAGTVMNVAGNTAGPTVGVAWTVRSAPRRLSPRASPARIRREGRYLVPGRRREQHRPRCRRDVLPSSRYPIAARPVRSFMGARVRVTANGTAPADGHGLRAVHPEWHRALGRLPPPPTSRNVWFAGEYVGKDSMDPYRAQPSSTGARTSESPTRSDP
jgi:hypothetical protein